MLCYAINYKSDWNHSTQPREAKKKLMKIVAFGGERNDGRNDKSWENQQRDFPLELTRLFRLLISLSNLFSVSQDFPFWY